MTTSKKSAGKLVYSIATTKNGKINWIAQPGTKKQTNERFKHFAKSLHEEVIHVEIREVTPERRIKSSDKIWG